MEISRISHPPGGDKVNAVEVLADVPLGKLTSVKSINVRTGTTWRQQNDGSGCQIVLLDVGYININIGGDETLMFAASRVIIEPGESVEMKAPDTGVHYFLLEFSGEK